MHELYPVCCGIDVHRDTAVACIRRVGEDGKADHEIRTFSTMTSDLGKMGRWLEEEACPIAAVESTGVYWKPVYRALKEHAYVLVANARDCKPRKGKKTDKADASWIAELLALGFLKPSFIPPPEVAELRELCRTRMKSVQTRTAVKNRIHKLLQDAGIKLSSVATDIFGASGRAMLNAIVAGERDPKRLAKLAKTTLKLKKKELELAFEGHLKPIHTVLIEQLLVQLEAFDKSISVITARIEEIEKCFDNAIDLLCTIPGVSRVAARLLIGEIGTDMSQFGSAKRLAAWAGLSPGNNASAGKRRSGKTLKANRYIRATLTQCAWASHKTKSFLGRTFSRLMPRIGPKKAALAVAHKIIVIAYYLLEQGVQYDESRYAVRSRKEMPPGLKKAINTISSFNVQVAFSSVESGEPIIDLSLLEVELEKRQSSST